MAIVLTDDGTMDTVLSCTECGEEFRFNYEPAPWNENPTDEDYDDFVNWAIEETEDEHECAG